ncbi:MAG: hypothetical protein LBR81_05515 [Prevotellaceae bacterium]|nr:hypothetical protein [Prevotellaceae bacterium]
MLACGSLGLIGLSRFLLCSVSFFAPNPFSAVFAVFAPVVPPATHTAKSYLTQASTVIHSLHYAALHSILSFLPLPDPAKKLHFTAKNRASPAVNRRQPQPSFHYHSIAGYPCLPPSLHSQSARRL